MTCKMSSGKKLLQAGQKYNKILGQNLLTQTNTQGFEFLSCKTSVTYSDLLYKPCIYNCAILRTLAHLQKPDKHVRWSSIFRALALP